MDINEIYSTDSKFLRAEALPVNARVAVKIEGWSVETYKDGKKQIALQFEGKDKMLGLNITNARTIEGLIGTPNTDNWINHTIRLYRTKVEMEGKQVDAIRVDPSYCIDANGRSTIKEVTSDNIAF